MAAGQKDATQQWSFKPRLKLRKSRMFFIKRGASKAMESKQCVYPSILQFHLTSLTSSQHISAALAAMACYPLNKSAGWMLCNTCLSRRHLALIYWPRPDQNRLQGNHKYGSLAWVLRRMAWGDADGSRAARFSVFLPAKWPMTSQFLFAIDWEKWRHVETATPRQVFWTSGEGLLMRLCHWAIGDWGPKSSKGENWGFMSVEPSAYDQFVVVFVGRSDDMTGWFR